VNRWRPAAHTPQNSALFVIDYQPNQMRAVTSIDHELLTRNIVSVARIANAYKVPVVLSRWAWSTARSGPFPS
jgi:nicotinamidase-related amidase